jgi:hypothetical protein
VSGRSLLDQFRNEPDAGLVGRGSSHATLFVLGWRSTMGSSIVATQRVATSGYGFSNTGRLAPRSRQVREASSCVATWPLP